MDAATTGPSELVVTGGASSIKTSNPSAQLSIWFFMCGPLAANVFLFGVACNLYVFRKHNMSLERVFDMKSDEVPTYQGVFKFATLLLSLQMVFFWYLKTWSNADGPAAHLSILGMEWLLVLYVICSSAIVCCPLDILHRKCRYFVLKRIGRCLWPFRDFALRLPASPTPFVEVFIADGLTSLSKSIQDTTVALLLLFLSYQGMEEVRNMYISKTKHSLLPYFAASMPYIIRATQCLISFQRTTNASDRSLHLLNTIKYCSSIIVISVGAYPQVLGLPKQLQSDRSTLFLLCAVFNSLYSFCWDVVMDWGLGQPGLPKQIQLLRHQLFYRPNKLYYVVIGLDLVLRILWATKWWAWREYGVDFKLVSQVGEVLRRCMWNFLRVEWQCIKLSLVSHRKMSEDDFEMHSENLAGLAPLKPMGSSDRLTMIHEGNLMNGFERVEPIKLQVAPVKSLSSLSPEVDDDEPKKLIEPLMRDQQQQEEDDVVEEQQQYQQDEEDPLSRLIANLRVEEEPLHRTVHIRHHFEVEHNATL